MILRYIPNLFYFATAKYSILNGKYLIPVAPKRPQTSFILYSTDARKKIEKKQGQKEDVTETSKLLGQQWNKLQASQKQKYEKKAQQLRQKYQKQKQQYNAKYVQPFKNINYNNLIIKQYYSKNKVASLAEGVLGLKKFRQSLTEKDLEKYKRLADQINKENQKIKRLYQIPTYKHKTFSSYIKQLRTQNQKIPIASKMDEKDRKKYESKYQQQRQNYSQNLKKFAKSFHMKNQQLIKLINKNKDKDQKLTQQGYSIKQSQKKQLQKHDKQIKKLQKEYLDKKKTLKTKTQASYKKETAKMQKQLDKLKKMRSRVKGKYDTKLTQVKRKRTEEQVVKKSRRSKKEKDQKTQDLQNTQTAQKSDKQTSTNDNEKKTEKTQSKKTATKKSQTKSTTKRGRPKKSETNQKNQDNKKQQSSKQSKSQNEAKSEQKA